MIFIIVYGIIGFFVAIYHISTIEGNDIYMNLNEDEQKQYFINVTVFWPKYL